jgi:hypothetical protein
MAGRNIARNPRVISALRDAQKKGAHSSSATQAIEIPTP